MMRVFVCDNYDSFTYNLVQYLGVLGAQVEVARNDAFEIDDVVGERRPDCVLISPGPGTPDDAGLTLELVDACALAEIPLLGVCLGHQAIAQSFGGKIVRAPKLMHGKTSMIAHNGTGVFEKLDNPFEATRYHSLCVEPTDVPDCLEVTAHADDGVIMGLAHRELPIHGVQFHPESILTTSGMELLRNFLNL